MMNENEAENAISELTGTLVKGSRMRVEVGISDIDKIQGLLSSDLCYDYKCKCKKKNPYNIDKLSKIFKANTVDPGLVNQS